MLELSARFKQIPVTCMAIDFAVDDVRASDIVLCGHSSGSATADQLEVSISPNVPSFSRFTRRLRRREELIDLSQHRLVQHLEAPPGCLSVFHALFGGQRSIHALFDLADSGSSTRYDLLLGRFEALGDIQNAECEGG